MAIDEKLSQTVRAAFANRPEVSEVKMFGGVCFTINGNMAVGASDRGLLVRVGKDAADNALGRPGASTMVMGGRDMPGYIRVAGVPLDAPTVKSWVRLASAFVETLPPKAAKPKTKRKA